MEENKRKKEQKLSLEDREKLLNLFKQVPGDYGKLLVHYFHNIITEDFRDNINWIVMNPNVSIKIINEMSKLNLGSVRYIRNYIKNPNITIHDIEGLKIDDYKALSSNPNLNWKFIESKLDKPSGFDLFYKDQKEEFLTHQQIIEKWDKLSQKKKNDWNKDAKDYQWDFKQLSSNSCITFDIVSENLEYNWDIEELSRNTNITLKIVKDNLDLKWNDKYLAQNKNIKLKDIFENKDIFTKPLKEYIHNYIFNPNINIKEIIQYKDLFRDQFEQGLGQTPNISIPDIIATPFLNWNGDFILSNPNITYKTIIDNDSFIFRNSFAFLESILQNKFGYDKLAKHRYDVDFPKYWLLMQWLYSYIYKEKDVKDVYKIAQEIFKELNQLVNETKIKQSIPSYIIEYNEKYNLKSNDVNGFIYHAINSIVAKNLKIDLDLKIDDTMSSFFLYAYRSEGGNILKFKSLKLSKDKCFNDTDLVLQIDEIKDTDLDKLISFEYEGKVYCLIKENLIDYWNQEPDEHGTSNAFIYGDCEFTHDDIAIENTCKKFYNIPLSVTIRISEKDKNKIESDKTNYWKLEKDRIISMGRHFHYYGENNEDEMVYKAVKAKHYDTV